MMMGRNFRIGAAVAAVLVLASVAVASATSSGDNRSSDSDGRKVIVFDMLANVVDSRPIVADPNNPTLGDTFVSAVDLTSGGKPIGRESSICVITRIEQNGAVTLHCTGVSSLPGGQVTTELSVEYGPGEDVKADPYPTSIKGGTGKYRTARGDGRLQDLGEVAGEQWRLTLRIIL